MALSKKFVTPYGVDSGYWKIANITVDYLAQMTKIILAGYVDESKRRSGAQPLASQTVEVRGEEFAEDPKRADLYAKIKLADAWADADDVLEAEVAKES